MPKYIKVAESILAYRYGRLSLNPFKKKKMFRFLTLALVDTKNNNIICHCGCQIHSLVKPLKREISNSSPLFPTLIII